MRIREFEFSDRLKKVVQKIHKKDRRRYEILMKKIKEVLSCENPDHYKNLRSPLQQLKRVHIDSSFVLTFKHFKKTDKIQFHDFDHHDNIYR